MRIDEPTPTQLAHNDQVLADINRRIDDLIEVHRKANEDDDLHPQVQLAGFAEYLERHSDTASLAQFLAVAIDRLLRATRPQSFEDKIARDHAALGGHEPCPKSDATGRCRHTACGMTCPVDGDTAPNPSGGDA